MLDKIIEAKELFSILLPVIISFLILLSRLFKNKKYRYIAENLIHIEESVKEYMCQSENFSNFTGEDKKEWVKTKVNQFCIKERIDYNDKMVDELIEVFIKFSKSVNKREKEIGDLL